MENGNNIIFIMIGFMIVGASLSIIYSGEEKEVETKCFDNFDNEIIGLKCTALEYSYPIPTPALYLILGIGIFLIVWFSMDLFFENSLGRL